MVRSFATALCPSIRQILYISIGKTFFSYRTGINPVAMTSNSKTVFNFYLDFQVKIHQASVVYYKALLTTLYVKTVAKDNVTSIILFSLLKHDCPYER